MTDLDRAIDLILKHEGGFVDHPADRGGATRYGITTGTLSGARSQIAGLPTNVRDLTKDQARLIYAVLYWGPSSAPALPWPACYAQMDAAVQHGPGQARRLLQAALGVEVDGVIGPKTRAAIQATNWGRALPAMLIHRALYYMRILANPSQAVFARGWANRLEDVAKVKAPVTWLEEDAPGDFPAPTISIAGQNQTTALRPILVPARITRISDVTREAVNAEAQRTGRSRLEVAVAYIGAAVDRATEAHGTAVDVVRALRWLATL